MPLHDVLRLGSLGGFAVKIFKICRHFPEERNAKIASCGHYFKIKLIFFYLCRRKICNIFA